jgi:hypothetical protein
VAAAAGPDAVRRMTGGGGGNGGCVGNEDEEAKRADGGTLEEVEGARRRRRLYRCGGPNLTLMVCQSEPYVPHIQCKAWVSSIYFCPKGAGCLNIVSCFRSFLCHRINLA